MSKLIFMVYIIKSKFLAKKGTFWKKGKLFAKQISITLVYLYMSMDGLAFCVGSSKNSGATYW